MRPGQATNQRIKELPPSSTLGGSGAPRCLTVTCFFFVLFAKARNKEFCKKVRARERERELFGHQSS